MTKKALFVTLDARPGKEKEVAEFLRAGQRLVQEESGTTAWFGLQINEHTFAIFDCFADDAARDAHLAGEVARTLRAKAKDLFSGPPQIEKIDVLFDKLPA
jgi:quinol monooxygenase YgiN